MKALLAGLFILAGTVPAFVQQDPGFMAREACEEAVTPQIRDMIEGADRVGFDDAKLSQASNAETGVTGTGEAENKKFSYTCLYNIRDGSTSKIKIVVK